ncbi:helix-turn-helix domain-containing protein [Shewanella sp.]|uniref:helix-turn-helix domain-containing protein n=1 Tax=Shewanella sp. TaxID=50422 RepID=UPI0025886C4E|nr:helix-turn-helix domain-containing protein [Shewanella sp.]MCJ8304953.1 helix-turn-helix domain-containing protein [Shewanella sp.]
MQFPQTKVNVTRIRGISTSNVEELAQFQDNKNRLYTQMQAGVLNSHYIEANLGEVQVFRERLNAGARIEATPASMYLPFAAILPESGDYRFCGRSRLDNSIIQATGGHWDFCFDKRLDYVCTAFNRESLHISCEILTGRELPKQWLVSQASVTGVKPLLRYAQGIGYILHKVQLQPELLQQEGIRRLLSAQTLKLTLDALEPTVALNDKLRPQARRILGVRRVIDYLQVYAARLPSIQMLCEIADLSERSLEYGFQEYLNVTPIRYLRLVRLNGARVDLLSVIGTRVKVADIALKWGFLELGRFSGEYKKMFKELPSETMSNIRC